MAERRSQAYQLGCVGREHQNIAFSLR
jgi:hypothetical protein